MFVDSWIPLIKNLMYSEITGNYIEVCPVISVPFDVSASKNWPYNLSGFGILGDKFRPLCFIYDKCFITTGFDTKINLDIPLFQRNADGFNFALDGLLDGVEDDPGIRGSEGALGGMVSNKTAGISPSCPCHL